MSIHLNTSPHRFHIPVLGTGFSVDTPIKVAHLGIDSVMSVVDDELLEQARRHHAELEGLPYAPIAAGETDARARRTRAYLDLVDALVKRNFAAAVASFPDGEAARAYFDLLPPCAERDAFARLGSLPAGTERDALADRLRASMRPGSADINIMTKLDRSPAGLEGAEAAYYSDASASLRGFAESSLESTVVFSAGMNPRLFDYAASFDCFRPDAEGRRAKRICVKVSDYRSAFVQGLQLAKKGLWTSEFRVESGLNCGGHAFPTKGNLLGPILEEFAEKKGELEDRLYAAYAASCAAAGRAAAPREALDLRLTAQGGVGTASEHEFLEKRYKLSAVGWGSPFLLVPEAVNVDDESLRILAAAKEEDIELSEASPLGVPFWIVKNSLSEIRRLALVAAGRSGTACPKGYLAFDTEFGPKPRCLAAASYQLAKLRSLAAGALSPRRVERIKESVLAKACLCRDLASSFTRKVGLDPEGSTALTAGPNLAYFGARYSLSQLVGHIYGRIDLLSGVARPHVFVAEARLYLKRLAGDLAEAAAAAGEKATEALGAAGELGKKHFADTLKNIRAGIDYYEALAASLLAEERERFTAALASLREEAERLVALVDALPDPA